MLKNLKYIFYPSYWIMINHYNEEWDKKINELMDNNKFIITSQETARLWNIEVWIANHPYASFSPFNPIDSRIRPSRSTIDRAFNKIIEDAQ